MRMRKRPFNRPRRHTRFGPRRHERRRRAARSRLHRRHRRRHRRQVAARKPRAHLLLRRGRRRSRKRFLWSARDVEERGLTVVPHEPVARLDVAKRTVASESGRTWRFSACLVATGSSPASTARAPRSLQPLTLRTVDDAEAFAAALGRANANVLVSGTSMVALKRRRSLPEKARVTVLGRSEHIFEEGGATRSPPRTWKRSCRHAG